MKKTTSDNPARDAIFRLDQLQTKLENAASLLFAIYEAMERDTSSQKENASAVWGLWDYLTTLLEQSGALIEAGIHESEVA